jgi:chitodextrinase
MNKLVVALGFVSLQFFGFSQNGLEKIIVEKYYVSTAADSIGSVGTLPVGSVTYRVYADMLPGYRFQALYGNADHTLKINSSTPFFNNEDRGATTANAIASVRLKTNTVALDSWFSVGASATGQFGVLKSEDNGAANLISLNSLLKNNAAAMGIPLTTQDGNQAGSPEAVTFVGIDPTGGIFDATSLQGNAFQTNNGAISALSGAVGPTSENRILIGQFTTNGVFTFELNIQIGTPTPGVSEKYVASNPLTGEFTIPSLTLTGNNPPVVEITSPTNDAKLKSGVATTITANATDTDGTISQVEFFEDGKSLGVDNTSPYSIAYTPTDGNHKITALAKDNKNAQTTSSIINIAASNNIPPVVSITAPAIAHLGKVTINANASDADGTIKEVAFYVDSVFIGKDSIAPYSYDWNAVLGKHKVYAVAKDDKGEKANSNQETIEVVTNISPVVSIIAPTNNDTKIVTGSSVLLLATASDGDGSIKKVEFFVDGKSVGVDSITPYSANYTAIAGSHFITVVATDDQLTSTTSSTVNITVKDNQLPIVSLTNYLLSYYKEDVVKITANAYDTDGSIAEVEFFLDSVSVGIDQTSPYSVEWIAKAGTHHIKAVAKDNNGAKNNSTIKTIEVKNFTASLEAISSDNTIQLFPNPAKDKISFHSTNGVIQSYYIADQLGRILVSNDVKENKNDFTETVNIEGFQTGVYLLTIEMENKTITQKFIVE